MELKGAVTMFLSSFLSASVKKNTSCVDYPHKLSNEMITCGLY
jgi:hypothetical protein